MIEGTSLQLLSLKCHCTHANQQSIVIYYDSTCFHVDQTKKKRTKNIKLLMKTQHSIYRSMTWKRCVFKTRNTNHNQKKKNTRVHYAKHQKREKREQEKKNERK